jgi:TonB family protein
MIGRLVMAEDIPVDSIPQSETLEVEIQTVTTYVSSCLIKGISYDKVPARSTVEFDLPVMDAPNIRDRAERALSAEDYNSALHLLLRLKSLDSSSIDSATMVIIDSCRQQIEKEDERKLSKREKKVEKGRAVIYHRLGTHFFTQDNFEAARFYLKRAVRADKDLEHAKHMLCVLDEGVPCDPTESGEPEAVEVYPKMVYMHTPEYPRSAKNAGIGGTVWVKALVDKTGTVLKAQLGKSSGSMVLDQAAVQGAYRNRFEPGIIDGKPVACWVTYKFEWIIG